MTNTGTAKASLTLGEREKGFTPQDRAEQPAGAAVQDIPGSYSPGFLNPAKGTKAATVPVSSAAEPWASIADLPTSLMDNAVAAGDDGKVYSVTGATSSVITSAGYVYDPTTLAWSPIADSGTPREAGQAAFVDGKLHLTGGWDASQGTVASLRIYDPRTGSWSSGAPNPRPLAGAASAVIDGKWYLIGGCTTSCGTNTVEVYDTDTDTWSSGAAYPQPISWLGCGAIDRALFCAGGTAASTSTKAAYTFDPSAGAWTSLPDMPFDLWGTGAVGANGKLLLSGGITDNSVTLTNKGVAYDPSTETWSNLPNSNNAVYRGGSACGFYKVGGSVSSSSPTRSAELLPGYGQCGTSSEASWLSEDTSALTLAPGASKTVTVDASGPEIVQPGTYTAWLTIAHDTPYQIDPITVAMTVNPPKTWGKISGTVSGTDCTGTTAAIRSATVQLDSWAESVTLKTDAGGAYAMWMDVRNNPLSLIVAKDGWAPKGATVKLAKGATVSEDFTLKPDHSCQ
ncbi:hypothetical protein NMG29_30890 [Streptomyces cocklensis]|uniref:Uncharacterized protein n=1 Tax=Actinacidiphila cocklensis TaxID=887465 RepID=A0A9W4GNY7_9ACTN|nr:hypothetical protein [Actinacidiphila cocklensis]MDD1062565.1 hypothetical protein [Actinacidiphila cocklensis]CAG6391875.1 hypothetical protein SCOCK_140073 [Actinacidiphila cocklensis]